MTLLSALQQTMTDDDYFDLAESTGTTSTVFGWNTPFVVSTSYTGSVDSPGMTVGLIAILLTPEAAPFTSTGTVSAVTQVSLWTYFILRNLEQRNHVECNHLLHTNKPLLPER